MAKECDAHNEYEGLIIEIISKMFSNNIPNNITLDCKSLICSLKLFDYYSFHISTTIFCNWYSMVA